MTLVTNITLFDFANSQFKLGPGKFYEDDKLQIKLQIRSTKFSQSELHSQWNNIGIYLQAQSTRTGCGGAAMSARTSAHVRRRPAL